MSGYFLAAIGDEQEGAKTMRWIREDELACECGNSPQSGGFYPANANGEEVDPISYSSDSDEVQHAWDGSTWLCGQCGAVEVVEDYKEIIIES